MLSLELSTKVVEYIEDEITLSDLRKWYGPKLPRFLKNPESEDADLIAAIELVDSEIRDGLRTEEEAREYVQAALHEHATVFSSRDIVGLNVSGTSSETVLQPAVTIPSQNDVDSTVKWASPQW